MGQFKRISGVTFIKNGISLGYPFIECIRSLSQICDEVIINVGFDDLDLTSDDGTYKLLREKFPEEKYIFLKSYWDPELSKGGEILAQQTNIALQAASGKYIQYLQGDECLHEDDFKKIIQATEVLDQNLEMDGAIFDYVHFYGNVDIFKHTKTTYRREVRLIRNRRDIKSWKDAQGFRHKDDTKLYCLKSNARIFHYGWARKEQIMNQKVQSFEKLYHGQNHQNKKFAYRRIWGLRPFKGTHPKIMKEWIENNKNDIDIMSLPLTWEWKNIRLWASDSFESVTGIRLGEYKNYKI
jgi:glycosyltransferase involved in cell wall biosynthesis